MKRALSAVLALLFTLLAARAQVKVDSLYFDGRASIQASVVPGGWNNLNLIGESLNLNLWGHLTPSVSYRFRQRFTLPLYDKDNPLNATDWLLISWKATPRWTFNAGKMPTLIGGYEWDYAPVDLHFWSNFDDTIGQYYALGGAVMYQVAEGQQLQLQVTRSLLSYGESNIWSGALGWTGSFAPWWKTIWAFTFMDDPYRHRMSYTTLGNRFEAGPVALEVDLMYRRALLPIGGMGPDCTIVGHLWWTLGNFHLFTKGGFDYNDAANVDSNGIPYDLSVAPGTRYGFAGGGVEYFPLGNRDVRLHAVGWWNSGTNAFVFNAGVTFRLYIVR